MRVAHYAGDRANARQRRARRGCGRTCILGALVPFRILFRDASRGHEVIRWTRQNGGKSELHQKEVGKITDKEEKPMRKLAGLDVNDGGVVKMGKMAMVPRRPQLGC